jgi:hypothetical protein
VRDVANNVVLCIEHWDGRYTLVVHHLQSRGKRLVAATHCQSSCSNLAYEYLLDGQNLLLSNAQILEKLWVQLVYRREAGPVLPEERDQFQLCQHANDI